MKQFARWVAVRALVVLCALCFLGVVGFAQEPGSGEVSGFGGILHVNSYKGADGITGGAFGFSGGYFWTKNVLLQAELGVGHVSKDRVGSTSETFAFGPLIQFPLKNNEKFAPFVRVDIDIVHGSVLNVGQTKPGFGFGGGIRCLAGKNWGVRPEFRFVKASDTPSFLVFDAGLYYDFGK